MAQLPRGIGESPSLEVFQNHGDVALRDSGWRAILVVVGQLD